MKENVFNIPEPFTRDFENDSKLTEQWKGIRDTVRKNVKDYGIETCSESDAEEDPICFQEYVGMLKDIITAVESGESFDTIKINYCKTDWNKLNEKVKEFENAGLRGNGTIVLEDMMIKKQFTTLEILKIIVAYLSVD